MFLKPNVIRIRAGLLKPIVAVVAAETFASH